MLPRFLCGAAALALAGTLSQAALADGIEVHDQYAISSGPSASSGAAFMVIHNHGGPDDHLVGAMSTVSERVELHTHLEDENGVMRMIEVVEGFALPRDGEILMQRGGHHVMFLGLVAPFEDGATLPLTLVFEVAGEVEIEVPVDLGRMMGDAMDHGAHGHDGHDHAGPDHGHDHDHDHGD